MSGFIWPVDACELAESPQEHYNGQGEFQATVKLRCAWADRMTLMRYAMLNGGMLYPRYPATLARCRHASAAPFSARVSAEEESAEGLSAYEEAIVALQFIRDRATPETVQLVSETLEPTAEFLTLDHKGFFWDTAKKKPISEMEAPAKLIRGMEYQITYHQVFAVPAGILTLPGCVNHTAITAKLLGLTFPAETLLFQPPTITRRISTREVEAWTCTYRLSFRGSTWNKFWRKETQQFAYLYDKEGAIYRNYPLANFAAGLPG